MEQLNFCNAPGGKDSFHVECDLSADLIHSLTSESAFLFHAAGLHWGLVVHFGGSVVILPPVGEGQ